LKDGKGEKMAKTINVTNGVSAAIVNADQASAVIRTALTKSASCATMKASATNDSRHVDSVRGNKYAISSIVQVDGVVSIENNSLMDQRVDRVKLMSQAVVNILRTNVPVTKNTLKVEMDRLHALYRGNVDLKQPDAEAFDSMIAEQFTQEAADSYKESIRKVEKSGNFSVSNLKVTLLESTFGVEGENAITFNVSNDQGARISPVRQHDTVPPVATKKPRTKRVQS
jgi:aspartate carbamoyltransferase regulatory subunit